MICVRHVQETALTSMTTYLVDSVFNMQDGEMDGPTHEPT